MVVTTPGAAHSITTPTLHDAYLDRQAAIAWGIAIGEEAGYQRAVDDCIDSPHLLREAVDRAIAHRRAARAASTPSDRRADRAA